MNEPVTKLRAWRLGEKLNLDQACELFAKNGLLISSAKLSRMERDQDIPLSELPKVQAVTGIPAKELAPDIAKIFQGDAP